MDACCFRTSSPGPPSRTIRVVHLDGLIQDYKYPTTIDEIIAIFPKHFVTTPIRLWQIGLIPLKPDTHLEPGRIYFLLPYAILRFNDSSDNLICLTRKLTKIAKTRQVKTKPARWANRDQVNGSSQTNKAPTSASPQVKVLGKILITRKLSNIAKNTRSKTKHLTKQAGLDSSRDDGSSQISNDGSNQISNDGSSDEKTDMRRSTKGRFSWKPLLSTIREISFNRRESDVSFNRRDSTVRD